MCGFSCNSIFVALIYRAILTRKAKQQHFIEQQTFLHRSLKSF